MELKALLNDMTPEELEPRLELQILTDPLSAFTAADTNNNNNNNNKPPDPPIIYA
jgi:hypothetical protein